MHGSAYLCRSGQESSTQSYGNFGLSRPPDGVLRLRIAMAGGPGEHRRLDMELEEVLFLTWRWHREIGTLVGELPCQPIAGLGMRDVAGHPAQGDGVLAVCEGERMH